MRSIIGRYLEHERIFVFGRGDAQEVFFGSGDLLERNTVRRIEAFAAVTDPEARAEVLEVLSAMRRDNRQDHAAGRLVSASGADGRAVREPDVSAHVFRRAHRAKARSLRPVSATEKAAMVAAAVELAEKQLTEFKLWDLTSAKKRV